MYEYAPRSDKKLEKILFSGLLLLAAIFYIGSMMPNMPLPAMFQAVAFLCITFAIILISRYLITRYVYRVQPSQTREGLDFEIVEYCGRRITTVCRIGVSEIVSVTPVTRENRRALARTHKRATVYRYTGTLSVDGTYLLYVEHGEEHFYLYILSDAHLERILSSN